MHKMFNLSPFFDPTFIDRTANQPIIPEFRNICHGSLDFYIYCIPQFSICHFSFHSHSADPNEVPWVSPLLSIKALQPLIVPFSRIGFNGVCPNYENCNYKHYHPKNLIPTLEQFELDPNDYIAKMLNCVGSKDLLIYFDGLVHLIVNTPQVRDSINFRDLFKKVTLYKVWVVNHNHFLERLQQHYFIMLPRSSHHQGLSDWAASEGRGPICPAYSVLGPFHSL